MANKYTALPIPPKEDLENLYHNDFLSQSEVGVKYNTTQKVVLTWFRKLGIKSRIAYKRNQSGKNNHSWRGDDATYSALHLRVEKERGKPCCCEVCGTTEAKRYEWANLTGNYTDVMDYSRMCTPCHKKYDNQRSRRTGNSTITVKFKM